MLRLSAQCSGSVICPQERNTEVLCVVPALLGLQWLDPSSGAGTGLLPRAMRGRRWRRTLTRPGSKHPGLSGRADSADAILSLGLLDHTVQLRGLLPALRPAISSGSVRGAGEQTGVNCVPGRHLTCCTVTPPPQDAIVVSEHRRSPTLHPNFTTVLKGCEKTRNLGCQSQAQHSAGLTELTE